MSVTRVVRNTNCPIIGLNREMNEAKNRRITAPVEKTIAIIRVKSKILR